MSPHYLVKCTTFSEGMLHFSKRWCMALKKAGCGLALVALKITGCDVWQMECQASNVTANVQSDHLLRGYMLPVFSKSDQLHHTPRSAKFSPCCNASATRPYSELVLDTCEKMKKMKHLCILQGNVVTFFRCCG